LNIQYDIFVIFHLLESAISLFLVYFQFNFHRSQNILPPCWSAFVPRGKLFFCVSTKPSTVAISIDGGGGEVGQLSHVVVWKSITFTPQEAQKAEATNFLAQASNAFHFRKKKTVLGNLKFPKT